jgi:hypothetical protein
MNNFLKDPKPHTIAALILSQAHFKSAYGVQGRMSFQAQDINTPYIRPFFANDYEYGSTTQEATVPIVSILGSEMNSELWTQVLTILDDAMQHVFSDEKSNCTAIASMQDKEIKITYSGRTPFPKQKLLNVISLLSNKNIPTDIIPISFLKHTGCTKSSIDELLKTVECQKYIDNLLQKVSNADIIPAPITNKDN